MGAEYINQTNSHTTPHFSQLRESYGIAFWVFCTISCIKKFDCNYISANGSKVLSWIRTFHKSSSATPACHINKEDYVLSSYNQLRIWWAINHELMAFHMATFVRYCGPDFELKGGMFRMGKQFKSKRMITHNTFQSDLNSIFRLTAKETPKHHVRHKSFPGESMVSSWVSDAGSVFISLRHHVMVFLITSLEHQQTCYVL